MKRATNIARDELVALGVCVGKFTHSDKFRLTIGALELLATYAKHKVGCRPASTDMHARLASVVREPRVHGQGL